MSHVRLIMLAGQAVFSPGKYAEGNEDKEREQAVIGQDCFLNLTKQVIRNIGKGVYDG
jgi:hypothetical protein